uniref:7,8-diamino-pelargonic acid aminotransferase n=1 Tax=Hanusia phi TaxID=3032 RepID=A0A7S0E974_9CRYP
MVKKGFGGYLGKSIPVFGLPPLPRRRSNFSAAALRSWFLQCQDKFEKVTKLMETDHKERLQLLMSAEERARSSIWWPFTQHDLVQSVTHIDARTGEDWWVYSKGSAQSKEASPSLLRWVDGAASWWTQGVDANLHQLLTKALAYGCGRYGHVLFPENSHEAALQLTERILKGPAKGWGSRVFFSDDGSTAVEVALKMAMRKFLRTHSLMELAPEELSRLKIRIMGLKGSYHGDTLGAMNAQAPSVFTGFKQMPWYDPKGVWLDIPTLAVMQGNWRIDLSAIPQVTEDEANLTFASWAAALDMPKRAVSSLATSYRNYITSHFDNLPDQSTKIGALVLEIAMHGAGGMDLIDPLFQRILVEEANKRSIPVIADEVFSGMWRLGMPTACSMGGFHPDIACYSKLLTGGTVPMALTVASEDVFQAFAGSEKSEALLHGHSYTAHPIGCSVAIAAFDIFSDPALNPNLSAKQDKLEDLWPIEEVVALSQRAVVKRVVPLGTVLVLELQPAGSKEEAYEGYASSLAKPYVEELRSRGIFLRPLGNVMYVMVTPTTSRSKCREIVEMMSAVIPK